MTRDITTNPRANKTDAGNGSKAICRVSNVLRSPSPDPKRSREKMNHDSDIIIEQVRAALPRVLIRQLAVAHPGADDDGVWFFTIEGSIGEIQMESSTYDLPFLVEHDQMNSRDDAILATSVDQVVGAVCAYFAGLNRENAANKGRQATASPSPAT